MKRFKTISIFLLLSFISIYSGFAEENSLSLNLTADVMNRYIFRGTDFGDSPSLQPCLSLKTGNFEIGYWGAISLTEFYQEIDLYMKYSIAGFSVYLTDYYIPYAVKDVPASSDIRYFTFDDKKTAHTLEAALEYQFPESFPLKLYGSVLFFGNDKRWGYDAEKDLKEDNYYSSYFEISYPFEISGNNLNVFLGLTPQSGAFGNDFGVVNFGFTGTKNIKISNDFELPVKSSVIFNPQASKVFFVFGITI